MHSRSGSASVPDADATRGMDAFSEFNDDPVAAVKHSSSPERQASPSDDPTAPLLGAFDRLLLDSGTPIPQASLKIEASSSATAMNTVHGGVITPTSSPTALVGSHENSNKNETDVTAASLAVSNGNLSTSSDHSVLDESVVYALRQFTEIKSNIYSPEVRSVGCSL